MVTPREAIEVISGFRYRLNPEESRAFEKAKAELATKRGISYRNKHFLQWMVEKYQTPFKLTAPQ